jgi:MATE family multidrug resistance protein
MSKEQDYAKVSEDAPDKNSLREEPLLFKLGESDKNSVDGETSSAFELVKELLPFRNGILSVPTGIITRIIFSTLLQVITIAPSLVGRIIVNTSGFVFFNTIGDPLMQASFGVFEGYFFIFFFALLTALLDKFSIDMALAFGEKNYGKIKNTMSKSLLVCMVLLVFLTIPMMLFASPILRAIAIEEEIADNVQYITRLGIPMMIIVTFSEYLKGFCLSQGYEKPFGYSVLITLPPVIAANYVLMIKYDYGIKGWMLTKTVQELFLLGVTLVVYFKTEPAARGLCSLKETLQDFGSFFYQAMKYMFGIYVECLAWELNGYFIALSGSTDQIAAYYCIVNVSGICFCIGFAFALICRTRMNILVGIGEHRAAKNYFHFFIWVNSIVGILVMLTVYSLKNGLVTLYSDSTPGMKHWFNQLVTVMVMLGWCEVSINAALVGLKSVGRINILLLLDLFFPLGLNFIGGLILHQLGYNCDSQLAHYKTIAIFMLLSCTYFALDCDWSKLSTGKRKTILAMSMKGRTVGSVIRP